MAGARDRAPRGPRRCRRRRTSSAARCSTTSGPRSRCSSSPASTRSAWRGCGSRPRRPCSRSGGGPGAGSRARPRRPAHARRDGAVLAVDERVLLRRDRPAAAGHGRRDRVPAGDRARRGRGADGAQRGCAARSRSPASTCSPTSASSASRSGSPSRSRTRPSSRSTSCSGTASPGSGRWAGIDGLAAAMLVAAVAITPIGGPGAAPALLDPVALARRHRRRRRVVGDPVRLRPARDAAAGALDLRAARLAAARDGDRRRRRRARAVPVARSRSPASRSSSSAWRRTPSGARPAALPDAGGDDPVELREVLLDERVALLGHLLLRVRRLLAVACCRASRSSPWPLVTLANGAKPCASSDALSARLMKIWVVRVFGPAVAKVSVPRRVRLLDGIVLDRRRLPGLRDLRVRVDAELDDEPGDDAEEPHAVEVLVLDEVVEPVGPERRPVARDLDLERALRRLEGDVVGRGRLRVQRRGLEQRRRARRRGRRLGRRGGRGLRRRRGRGRSRGLARGRRRRRGRLPQALSVQAMASRAAILSIRRIVTAPGIPRPGCAPTRKPPPRRAAVPDSGASRARTGDLLAASQTLSQLSYGPVVAGKSSRASPGAALRGDFDERHVAPEILEPVEGARLGREDVQDDVEVVGDDPARLALAVDGARQQPLARASGGVHLVADRLRLARVAGPCRRRSSRCTMHTGRMSRMTTSFASLSWASAAIRRACSSGVSVCPLVYAVSVARSRYSPRAADQRPRRRPGRAGIGVARGRRGRGSRGRRSVAARSRRTRRGRGARAARARVEVLARIAGPGRDAEAREPRTSSGSFHARKSANWSAPMRKSGSSPTPLRAAGRRCARGRRARPRRPGTRRGRARGASRRRRDRRLWPGRAATRISSRVEPEALAAPRARARRGRCAAGRRRRRRGRSRHELERLAADLDRGAAAGARGTERALELLAARAACRRRGSRGRCGRSGTAPRRRPRPVDEEVGELVVGARRAALRPGRARTAPRGAPRRRRRSRTRRGRRATIRSSSTSNDGGSGARSILFRTIALRPLVEAGAVGGELGVDRPPALVGVAFGGVDHVQRAAARARGARGTRGRGRCPRSRPRSARGRRRRRAAAPSGASTVPSTGASVVNG